MIDLPPGTIFASLRTASRSRRNFAPAGGDGKTVILDFNVSQGPFETKPYLVEYGPKVAAGPATKGGVKVERDKEAVTVVSGGMHYVVPEDLRGFLQSVHAGKKSYLRKDSAGLAIHTRDGRHSLGGAGVKHTIARQGPLSVGLRFDVDEVVKGKRLTSVVELDLPRSKSWIEVRWTASDPDGVATALSASLDLEVEGSPTLVDFGAGSMVYTTLRKGQTALLRRRGRQARVGGLPGIGESPDPVCGRLARRPVEQGRGLGSRDGPAALYGRGGGCVWQG